MRKQDGFSLLEVLIAVSIFSVGLLAVASMQMTAAKGNHFSGALTEASYLAMDQMETLLSLPYTDDDLAAGGHPDPPLTESIYTVTWNVAEDETTDNTKTIDVTIAWTERGSPRSLSFQGIKAR